MPVRCAVSAASRRNAVRHRLSPLPRYRLSVSPCAAKVCKFVESSLRTVLFGILTTGRFFCWEKIEIDPPPF